MFFFRFIRVYSHRILTLYGFSADCVTGYWSRVHVRHAQRRTNGSHAWKMANITGGSQKNTFIMEIWDENVINVMKSVTMQKRLFLGPEHQWSELFSFDFEMKYGLNRFCGIHQHTFLSEQERKWSKTITLRDAPN